ncbi:hypothetical protein DN594_00110, partial [Enterobacter cloacae]
LYIKDVGAFGLDKGKFFVPNVKYKPHLSVMSDVNGQVMRLQTEMCQLTTYAAVKNTAPDGSR